jgi:hypothetical protein
MSIGIHGHRVWAWAGPSDSVTGTAGRSQGGDSGSSGSRGNERTGSAPTVRHALWDALQSALQDLAAPNASSDGAASTSPAGDGITPSETAPASGSTAPADLSAPSSSTPTSSSATPAASTRGDGDHDEQGTSDVRHALHAFMHQLFQVLRPATGDAGAPGRHGHGFGWGRQSPADIAQRLEALAQSLLGTGGGTDATTASSASSVPASTSDSSTAPSGSTGGSDATSSPDAPASADATTASAASDLATQTPTSSTSPKSTPCHGPNTSTAPSPTSSLLAAFDRLMTALHAHVTAQGGATGSSAAALASLLHRLSTALSSSDGVPTAGALIHVTA